MKLELLEHPFSPEQIKQRAGNFGQTLSYIEGWAVIQRLNQAFDGHWSFHVESYEVQESEVIVLGNLIAAGITKTQFGSSTITRAKNSGDIISLADDLKAAATDALKKCATLFGVGLHLYSNSESNQEENTNYPQGKTIYRQQQPTYKQPTGANRQVNNGGGNGSTKGDKGQGRLSQKQHSFLLHLADDRGVSRKDLDSMSKERFSCVVSYLSRGDASCLIKEMTAN